jgi:S-adenosylmethionine:tRNA ribosyltransferase-isomerase
MQISEFDFALPPDLIAVRPANPRDAARLLHVSARGLDDRVMADLPSLLRAGDLLIVNDTKVIPAQLEARRGAARIGITLDQAQADGAWRVLLRNARRVKAGDRLDIEKAEGFSAIVRMVADDGSAVLQFNVTGEAFMQALAQAGALALPPYIPRPDGVNAQDQSDYQTLFATHEGAVAAPTAGLHFTPSLVAGIEARGARIARVTLHVGAGTFLPVRSDDVTLHNMHAERGVVSAAAADLINETKRQGGRVICVGTTSLRVVESAADEHGIVHSFDASTDIFILPGYRFRVADLLLTNFHLPRSTLLMLVSAFSGMARIRQAYAHAMAEGYRFYSYGDATLLERA